jgi:hypothetical protein
MKKLFAISVLGVLLVGCLAHVTPEGTYLEPLPTTVVIGPPVIVAPPPHVVVRPLPPVVLYPERRLYFYSGSYYYHYGKQWYYSQHKRGPWHRLHERYYPSRSRRYDERREHRGRHGY